jgi:hypothetical protein
MIDLCYINKVLERISEQNLIFQFLLSILYIILYLFIIFILFIEVYILKSIDKYLKYLFWSCYPFKSKTN